MSHILAISHLGPALADGRAARGVVGHALGCLLGLGVVLALIGQLAGR